jgi:hypothetical protein
MREADMTVTTPGDFSISTANARTTISFKWCDIATDRNQWRVAAQYLIEGRIYNWFVSVLRFDQRVLKTLLGCFRLICWMCDIGFWRCTPRCFLTALENHRSQL